MRAARRSMHFMGVVVALAFCTLFSRGEARAQECASGRVVTDGYCCWPAQRWSEERRRCEGPPACPDGFNGAGDDCVAVTVSPPAPASTQWVSAQAPNYVDEAGPPTTTVRSLPAHVAAPVGPPAVPGSDWPSSSGRPAGASSPHHVPALDDAVIGGGLAFIASGYAVSVGLAVGAFEHRGLFNGATAGGSVAIDATCYDTAGALFLIPIVGALAGLISHLTCSVPTYQTSFGLLVRTRNDTVGPVNEPGFAALGAVSAVAQLTGLVVAVVGATVPRDVLRFGGENGEVSLRLGTGAAGLGAELIW